jgi:tetratricopeptide (TPR) repeat protein
LARDCEQAFWESSDEAWIAAFKSDMPDVVAALEDAVAADDVALAGDLGQVAQLWDYLQNLGGAIRRRMKMAASMLRSLDQTDGDGRNAGLLNVLSFFSELQPAQPEAWQRTIELRLAAWKHRGDDRQVFRALNALAIQRSSEGRPSEARRLLDEATRVSSPSWPPRLLATGAYANAFVSMFERDARRYREHTMRTLALYRQVGAVQDQLRARVMLADAQVLDGAHGEGAAALEGLAAEAEESGQAFGHVGSMILLSCARILGGDVDVGRLVAERALKLARDRFVVDALLAAAAFVDTRRGELERAARLLGCCPPYRRDGRLGWANEARVSEQARAELDGLLPPDRLAELLAEGGKLDRDERFALMRLSFAPPP